MKLPQLQRPSPALVIALIALFVSMGGVSYGLATGSIDSREIKNGTIRGKDVSKDAITARELRRRSLDGTDIKIERVGGDAVKEQVLESGKIGKVPNAGAADTAGAAGIAGFANTAGSAPPAGAAGGVLSGGYPAPGLAADLDKLVPVAVVNVAADGTLRASSHRAPVTGTPIVTHVGGSAFYDVDLPGVKFFFSDDAANCSSADGDSKIVSLNSINGDDLRVRVRTDAGLDTEGALYCAIYNLT